MSTDGPESGLRFWLPELVAALDTDHCGAGAQLRSILTGRTARIGLDDDIVLVESLAESEMRVQADDPGVACDGSGFTTTVVVLGLLDADLEIDQAVRSGGIEIRSPISDTLWMYRMIELLLDASSRVPQLRELARQFRDQAGTTHRQPFVDWRTGSSDAESALLGQLGLLAEATVDLHA
ncbi:hypothetical protein AB0H36_41830 [Kribbella sp. NPDC050820]|uniref:hypothetical protein n=1 Tax=Kribbella sp. NPDC050820 TaxID=3155408 RepID=UPI0033E8776D